MNRKKILYALLTAGMLISLFLLYEHFSVSAGKFCKFGENFDCGIVNKSPYANLDGISYLLSVDFGLPLPFMDISSKSLILDLLTSNAFLGFLTLLFMLFLVNAKHSNKNFLWIKANKTRKWLLGVSVFSVSYGFYLFLVQHFILRTYCIFCLILDVILICVLFLAVKE
ncbi:MAG: vitamin K epoxide reductase family protein [Nanoarchaeota archaeon]